MIADLEKLETLCHVRACMMRVAEHLNGRSQMTRAAAVEILEDGMEQMTQMILEAKHGTKN